MKLAVRSVANRVCDAGKPVSEWPDILRCRSHILTSTSSGEKLDDVDAIWEFVVESSSASAEDDGFAIMGADAKKKKKKKNAKKSPSLGAKPSITLSVMESMTGPGALSRVPPHRFDF